MPGRQRELKEAVKVQLEELGVTDYEFTSKNGHHTAHFTAPDGRRRKFQFAGAPSDVRSVENTRCKLRRYVRSMGEQI